MEGHGRAWKGACLVSAATGVASLEEEEVFWKTPGESEERDPGEICGSLASPPSCIAPPRSTQLCDQAARLYLPTRRGSIGGGGVSVLVS